LFFSPGVEIPASRTPGPEPSRHGKAVPMEAA